MGGGDVTGPGWKPDQNIQSRYLTPYALRHADHITSWSRSMADIVRPYCRPETPIDVVHGGIHLERFTPGEKPQHLLERYGLTADDRVVFSPRLMRPLSNIIEIAKAAETVVRECPSAYFLVAYPATVTETDYADNVRAAFDGGPAAGRYKFVSEIAHDEIADHFRLADMTVSIPSTDGTPMTVLESMACGTPTVIGDLPDYDREYFENGRSTVMVDVKEPRSIADGILRVLKDSSLAESIAAEARARVLATGGYEFQMAKMESIYKRFAPKK
jgi:glycosyltransferase involved in cell wall biosynthesis